MKHFAIRLPFVVGYTGLVLAACMSFMPSALAQAEGAGNHPVAEDPPTLDAAATFTTIYANAQPGNCGCFFMYGGSGQLVANDPAGLSFLVDFGQTRKKNINDSNYNLTLTTYLSGLRYHHWTVHKFTPYAEILVGAAHSGSNFAIDKSTSTFAFAPGGGIDYKISSRFTLRVVQAQYLLTQVPNGTNDRQNQLRLTAGVVYHITKRRPRVKDGVEEGTD